jgi:hypothetical protein
LYVPTKPPDCRYQGGPLLDYLKKVKTWLDGNPNEGITSILKSLTVVITILFTNPDGINVTTWADDFTKAGISDMAYIPPFNNTPNDTLSWPTLSTMITSGKRVVIFLDSKADTTLVPWILDEFTFMWETPTGRLAVVNHFLDTALPNDILIPDRGQLEVTNGVSGEGSLGFQAENCAGIYGRYPNFMLVDCRSLE